MSVPSSWRVGEGGTEVPAEASPENGWERRRQRVSTHIEHVALTMFASRGYSNVTLNDIAAAAGVSPRTLTRYFPGKEDLLLSQPRRSAKVALASLDVAPRGEHAVESLWDMWIQRTRMDKDDLAELRLWYRAIATAPQAYARGGIEMSALIRSRLTEVAAESLNVPPDSIQAKVLAAALAAAQEAVLDHWLAQDGSGDLGDVFVGALEGLRQGFTFPSQP
jgi:AcrR family transcriptional regulator